MTSKSGDFWDTFTCSEAESVQRIMEDLANVSWAQSILKEIKGNGGLTRANKAKFFELRFGYALHIAGITPEYETKGEAESKLDFGFTFAHQHWLVELMRLEETDAARRASKEYVDEDDATWSQQLLSSASKDPTCSEEGETLKAVQRICQKCERDGRSHKFLVPDNACHVILVDFRTFSIGTGGDVFDRFHVGLGGEFLKCPHHQRYWNGELISGVFNSRTQVRGAKEIRERVHFLGFVNERKFGVGKFGGATEFIANKFLFGSEDEMKRKIATWPLQPVTVLNIGE